MAEIAPGRMQVGLYIPNGNGPMTPYANRWPQIVELAQTAEATGFDSVWVADHMIFDFDDVEPHGRWECWTLLAALAAATRRVKIGPLVSCVGFRNPALLAKMAETVDEISNGRLELMLGAGWHEPEFTTYGFPFDHRASRFEESFAVIKTLLRQGSVDFTGQYVSAPGARMEPRGPRNGAIPLHIGTDGERLLQLTAREADGWNTTWTRDASEIEPRLHAVEAACREVGRDPFTLRKSACVFLDLAGATGTWINGRKLAPTPLEPKEAASLLRGYADRGIEQVMLWLDPGTPEGVERCGDVFAALRE